MKPMSWSSSLPLLVVLLLLCWPGLQAYGDDQTLSQDVSRGSLNSIGNDFHGTYHSVSSASELTLQLAQAEAGSTIELQAGLYSGHFVIDKRLHLAAQPGAVIDAQGQGTAVKIMAAGVVVSGLTVRNWGPDLYQKDAAFLLSEASDSVRLLNNHLTGPGFGIYAYQLKDLLVRDNYIRGDARLSKLDRGDGIHLLRVDKPLISDNQIHHVRDGVYLESGSGSQVYGNTFTEQQYGIHYMYTQDDEAMDNRASHLDGGYALMNAEAINLGYNRVSQAREFGVLLNMTNNARIHGNQIELVSAPDAPLGDLFAQGKGLFIYGARDNQIYGNYIAANDIGIAMALGGEGNQVYQNQFIDNSTQVRYVGEQQVEWSLHQHGNFWSDYRGWDLNGDAVGDSIYLPNDRLDRLFWLYPEASFLMESPVVKLLKWVDSRLQLNNLTGVMDSYPLMSRQLFLEASQ